MLLHACIQVHVLITFLKIQGKYARDVDRIWPNSFLCRKVLRLNNQYYPYSFPPSLNTAALFTQPLSNFTYLCGNCPQTQNMWLMKYLSVKYEYKSLLSVIHTLANPQVAYWFKRKYKWKGKKRHKEHSLT